MKNMLRILLLTLALFSFAMCSSDKESLLFVQKENWGEWHAGDSTSIQYIAEVYRRGNDTVYYTTNYYPNGVLKCKTLHIGDRLDRVYFVNDTMGNLLNYGSVENGNGEIKSYDFQGNLEYSGRYINGNKEGWWKFYHFSGAVLDSVLYREGYHVSPENDIFFNGVSSKNNLYN